MKRAVWMVLLSVAVTASSAVEFGGGGSAIPDKHDQTSVFEDMNRWQRYVQDRDQLMREGKLSFNESAGSHAMYDFPLRTTQRYPGYYGISNFVDLNQAFPDQLQDYNCGMRSYDLTSGYNHAGIDFFTWPFGWYKLDQDEVEVIAAEAGTITTKLDGNYDRVCGFNDPLNTGWNAVYVTHADGSVAWYGHLKNGSLTSKPVGATVAVGEYLGVVASSGNSTGPHLHFETRDSVGNVIEPYFGACNSTTTESWWRDQKPYYDSQINQLITHPAAPAFAACPAVSATPNAQDHFLGGERVYFAAYYSDQLSGQTTSYEIVRPDGSVYDSWTHASSEPHYAASYWYWSFILPASPPNGRWQFNASFEGQVVSHGFFVGDLIFGDSFD